MIYIVSTYVYTFTCFTSISMELLLWLFVPGHGAVHILPLECGGWGILGLVRWKSDAWYQQWKTAIYRAKAFQRFIPSFTCTLTKCRLFPFRSQWQRWQPCLRYACVESVNDSHRVDRIFHGFSMCDD